MSTNGRMPIHPVTQVITRPPHLKSITAGGPVHLMINNTLYAFGQIRKYKVQFEPGSGCWWIRVWVQPEPGTVNAEPHWWWPFLTEEAAWEQLCKIFNVVGP